MLECQRVPLHGLGLRAEPTGHTHAMRQCPSVTLPRPGPCRGPSQGLPNPVLEPREQPSPPGWLVKDQESQAPEAGLLASLYRGWGSWDIVHRRVLSKPPRPVSEGPRPAGSHAILRAASTRPSSLHLLRIRGTA